MAHDVIPWDADHPQVLHALVKKRAEIAGRIDIHRSELRRMVDELDHVDATILIFNPDVDIGAIRSKPGAAPHAAFRGEITRQVFRTIREATGRPVTADEIVARLVKERGANPDDRKLKALLLRRVRACLRMHGSNGVIRRAGLVGRLQGWEAVR